MAKKPQKPETKPNWFWDITARGWFFVIFYLLLSLILLIYASAKYRAPAPALLGYILFMPIGLIYLFGLFNNTDTLSFHFVYIFHALMVLSVILISYFRFRKNIILKWLIIILILLMILSFVGCMAYVQTEGYPIRA